LRRTATCHLQERRSFVKDKIPWT